MPNRSSVPCGSSNMCNHSQLRALAAEPQIHINDWKVYACSLQDLAKPNSAAERLIVKFPLTVFDPGGR